MFEKGPVFYVKDFIKKGLTDSNAIKECLLFSKPFHIKTIIFDHKNWNVDEAVLVPQNTRVIVDGVTIKQNDKVFDNIFRSDNFLIDKANPNGFPLAIEKINNIHIIGLNDAVLEGPDENRQMYHPTQKTTQEMIGDYWGFRGFQICFSRVENFEVSGFSFIKQRSWAVSLDRCAYGYIHHMHFNSTVKNGDGINIRLGCHDIKIEKISGTTSDDMIALNSLTIGTTYPCNQYVFPADPGSYLIDKEESPEHRDIYNIYISDIHSKTSHYSHAIALLSRNGHKIYNVSIRNVYDDNPVSISERLAVIGSYKGYSSGYKSGDMHTFRISNVISNSTKNVIVLNDVVDDFCINNIIQNRSDGELIKAVDMNGISISGDSVRTNTGTG